jgi:hypothetical protein
MFSVFSNMIICAFENSPLNYIASACFSMSFIFVLFMLHLLTVCALYVCLCDYVNICMYCVLLCIFGKKLMRACVYCYAKTEFK